LSSEKFLNKSSYHNNVRMVFSKIIKMKTLSEPKLRKAKQVTGKTLVFRDANPLDAEFIHALRIDSGLSQHLSSIDPELSSQEVWLADYKVRVDQAYFIIENKEGKSLGTVRFYDVQGNSFCWGSWILKNGAPKYAAIESALMVYSYAIDYLGFRQSHFDVRKGNESVWRFHERFGAERIGETEQNYLYKIDIDKISTSRKRYRKFLPEPIIVEI